MMFILKNFFFAFIAYGLNVIFYCAALTPSVCPFQSRNILPVQLQNIGDHCHPKQLQCDKTNIYYTIDGSCNNFQFPTWGQAGTPYTRFVPANYSDGFCALRTSTRGSALPLARKIRTEIIKSIYVPSDRFNILFYGFSQWLDHDVARMASINSQVPCCINDQPAPVQSLDTCLPIIIPKNDEFYSQFNVTCLDVKRAINTQTERCDNVTPCSPVNFQTAVFDLSVLYSPDLKTANSLRTFSRGHLKAENPTAPDLEQFPPIVSGKAQCPIGGLVPEAGGSCTQSGDNRVDQNPEIFIIEIIFRRLHNYIATKLKGVNPDCDDEETFQEARRLLIALYQHVIFAENVPLLIGYFTSSVFHLLPTSASYSSEYDPRVNPQTIASYGFSAGRTCHSMVTGVVKYFDSKGKLTYYRLRDKYFHQQFALEPNVFQDLVLSYSATESNRQDIWGDDEINNWLFKTPGAKFGMDLQSIDINRGRDAGIPPYNVMRQACGLCKLKNFNEFADEVADPYDIPKLKALYESIDDVDLYVAGMMEKPIPGSMFGSTLSCVLGEAFFRWKMGDRLYYEFPTAKFTLRM